MGEKPKIDLGMTAFEDLFKDAIKYMTVYQGRGEPEDYDQDLY